MFCDITHHNPFNKVSHNRFFAYSQSYMHRKLVILTLRILRNIIDTKNIIGKILPLFDKMVDVFSAQSQMFFNHLLMTEKK